MSFPTLILENQFGEVSNNFVKGGSSEVSCNFVVDSTNGNGLGIRSLKVTGPGIAAVYMHTSATAAVGNPNPAVGYIVVQFVPGFKGYVSGTSGFVAPLSGSSVNVTSGLTQFGVYVITSVGTTTPSQWQTLGLPTNQVPTAGQAFVAATASAGSGTGTVQAIAATGSGIQRIEVVGDPNQTVAASTGTGYMVLVCLAPTNSSTTTVQPTAPANGSVAGLTFSNTLVPASLI